MTRRPLPRLRHAEPPVGRAAAPPTLDAQALQRLHALDADGSRGFVVQVLHTYEASLVRGLGVLQQARADGALQLAGDTAHTLKSSSAAVGAARLAAVCAELERQARSGDAAGLDLLLARVLDEADAALAAVRAMLPV